MRERDVKHSIRVALGRKPDLTLWNNPVGETTYDRGPGKLAARVRYGLVRGAADLVGILGPSGRWFCLEVKAPRQRTSRKHAEEQRLFAEIVRSRGGFAATVSSENEALAAYERARKGACK